MAADIYLAPWQKHYELTNELKELGADQGDYYLSRAWDGSLFVEVRNEDILQKWFDAQGFVEPAKDDNPDPSTGDETKVDTSTDDSAVEGAAGHVDTSDAADDGAAADSTATATTEGTATTDADATDESAEDATSTDADAEAGDSNAAAESDGTTAAANGTATPRSTASRRAAHKKTRRA